MINASLKYTEAIASKEVTSVHWKLISEGVYASFRYAGNNAALCLVFETNSRLRRSKAVLHKH